MLNLSRFETDLWSAADNLRANSKLTSSDYFMPVLGIIFLRHAANRFDAAARQIADDQAAGRMPKRKILPADYIRRRALFLPETARFDAIMAKATTDPAGLPKLVTDAMTAIEADFEPLANVLPKDYGIFEPKVLEELMRLFNSEQIKRATGDVFGRIYEYFLAKFSIQKAHDNGEFFTPSSLVQLIVNVIEPDHGAVFDPACGSGGMFVQSSHFIEQEGGDTTKKVVFYGQEKNRDTIRIAKMNLAVHGLEGKIAEAITYYQDDHNLGPAKPLAPGGCDFVMANPPFNVDLVDAERIKSDPRLPFGLPGVNKDKRVSNGNYLWISYFYSYLSEKGRAGFVMSSQASSAGNDEKAVRQKLVETGAVDVMISIKGGFFYTRTVPCELWFLDRRKPSPSPLAPLPGGEGKHSGHYRGGYNFAGLAEKACELRKNQTPAEEILWQLLRNRQLAGLKFRRQHQIGDYVTDFYCDEQKLIVELDGGIHAVPAKAKHDATRQKYLESLGLTVLRFPNESVLNSPESVLEQIAAATSPSPAGRGDGGEGDVALNQQGNVLMLDARTIGQLMPGSRKVYEFTPEQMRNLTAIVWLYRGENRRFAQLADDYFEEAVRGAAVTHHAAYGWCSSGGGQERLARLVDALRHFVRQANLAEEIRDADGTPQACDALRQIMEQLDTQQFDLRRQADRLYDAIEKFRAKPHKRPLALDVDTPKAIVHALIEDAPPLETLEGEIADFRAAVESFNKAVRKGADIAEKSLGAKRSEAWRKTFEMPAALDDMWYAEERLREAHHLLRANLRNFHWLVSRFPDAEIRHVPGLCRVVTRAEIEAADWSLTPGRYVGVAPAEVDEDFDFAQAMTEIHEELAGLNAAAVELAATIQENLGELGV